MSVGEAGGRPGGGAAGRLILVVGPSGAGKDSLIRHARQELAHDPRFVFPRRVVTRPPSAAEDNLEVGRERFAELAKAGAFLASWEAHGLSYGIPAEIADDLAAGRRAVCNVSRTVVGELRRRCPDVLAVEVTAPSRILAERLAARGRSADGPTGERLARSARIDVSEPPDVTVVNDGPLDVACRSFMDALFRP